MIRVLFVAAECAPFVKTGGLGDVAAALPRALEAVPADASHQSVDVRLLLPAYGSLALDSTGFREIAAVDGLFGGPAYLRAGRAESLDLVLLDAPHLFGREGNPYVTTEGSDWPDNDVRFAAFAMVASWIAGGLIPDWTPDIVHVHDWHAGLAPVYLAEAGSNAASVMTIHNIAYQGLFPATARATLGLPLSGYHPDGFEHYGEINFLKAGIAFADCVTTVSQTYADEIRTPEFGMGLEGLLAKRGADLVGIVNGVDTGAWDPRHDPALTALYGPDTTAARRTNKLAVLGAFGLTPTAEQPVFCVISRLTPQKGIDLLIEILPRFLDLGGRLLVLGSGDPDLEAELRDLAAEYPDRIGVRIGFDEALAHQMQAGCDAIIVPSRFEPCGLTQLYGLRYGCLPIVARVGGLADTVIDANPAALQADCATGFQFAPTTSDALLRALHRAIRLYADQPRWSAVVGRAMRHPVGWEESAVAYRALYTRLLRDKAASGSAEA